MSHFAYLQAEFPTIYEAAVKAEEMALSDPRGSAFYGRRAVDLAVNWAYKHDNKLRLPYQDNLSALIHEPSFIDLAGQSILTKAKLVIRLGNQAVHSEKSDRATRFSLIPSRVNPHNLLASQNLQPIRCAVGAQF